MADTLAAKFLTLEQVRNLPPVRPLIHGVLDLNSTSIIYGARGSYKSFLALDWALSVACGSRWQGRAVEYGPVVYVAAEGVSGLSVRVDAWLEAHPSQHPAERFRILPQAINLLSPPMVGEFVEACAALEPRLIILDTLARCFVGGDENGGKDGSIGIEQWDSIRRRTGACVLLVHHSGKNRESGSRGWSGWEGAADHVYETDAEDGGVTLRNTKAKNHAEPNPIRLQAVPTGDSMVLDAGRADSTGIPVAALELVDTLAEIDTGNGVSSTAWMEASGVPKRSFHRYRGGLVRANLVRNVGTDRMPRYQAFRPTSATGASEVPHPAGSGARCHPPLGVAPLALAPQTGAES